MSRIDFWTSLHGEPDLDEGTAVDRNLDLAGAFTAMILDNPALAEQVPPGATLVLVPDDDPDLMRHNIAAALQAFASGRNVYLVHIQRVQAG